MATRLVVHELGRVAHPHTNRSRRKATLIDTLRLTVLNLHPLQPERDHAGTPCAHERWTNIAN